MEVESDIIEDGGAPGFPPHGKAVIACATISAGLAGLIVGLRFFARLYPARLLGKEDWCIFIAWVCLDSRSRPNMDVKGRCDGNRDTGYLETPWQCIDNLDWADYFG